MPANNLAKVFGPTVVGYSCSEPAPMQIMTETRRQNQVMERLLEIPRDFWSDLLCVDEMSLFPDGTPYTPDIHSAPRSMLGPLNTPDMPEQYAHEVTRSTITPKQLHTLTKAQKYSVKTLQPKKPSRFFSSPLVN
ncbi:rac GTPase-activating protein 1 [Plakobranchus ocellatus]|uniref:Rac GTPase-activating protein 1 n=1 Tax=Plakobranchus ocellatus TaxID=259542 RepID=A0AAV3Y7N4_9GAST|nr:rac GTPase-activating protein 1 [Plakobranchus ocellatus]